MSRPISETRSRRARCHFTDELGAAVAPELPNSSVRGGRRLEFR